MSVDVGGMGVLLGVGDNVDVAVESSVGVADGRASVAVAGTSVGLGTGVNVAGTASFNVHAVPRHSNTTQLKTRFVFNNICSPNTLTTSNYSELGVHDSTPLSLLVY